MKKIKITYGGSHRKNKRCREKLTPFLVPDALHLRTTLGSNRMETTAFDSPELRAMLKQIGGSVSRHQPDWLNK